MTALEGYQSRRHQPDLARGGGQVAGVGLDLIEALKAKADELWGRG